LPQRVQASAIASARAFSADSNVSLWVAPVIALFLALFMVCLSTAARLKNSVASATFEGAN
jgi:cytochrome c-type biogenesis protein CcmH/NrfF